MSWAHRTRDGALGRYHEWLYSATRRFQDKTVEATATVDSWTNDGEANWEVVRDGSPVLRGHAGTVAAAKKAAFAAMWKRAAPWARRGRR